MSATNTQEKRDPSVSAPQNDDLEPLTITLYIEGGEVNKAYFRTALAFASRYKYRDALQAFITKYTDWQAVINSKKRTDYLPVAFAEAFVRHLIPDVVLKKVIGKAPNF
jgi:hypothetical protein